MAQIKYPISDISVGSWTDEGSSFNDGNLYTSIQEVTPDDDTSRAEGAQGAGTFECKLGTFTDPVLATGHICRLWGKGVGSGAGEKVDVFLYESTSLIATLANNWTPGRSAYAELSVTLSAGEANSISDYADLRIRVVEDTIGGGSERFNVTQMEMEVPDAVSIFEEDISLAVTNRTVVPVADLIRIGLLTLAVSNRTVVPTGTLTRIGLLTLTRDAGIALSSLIDTVDALSLNKDLGSAWIGNILSPQAVSFGKDLGSAWIGNILTLQALTLAITNRTIAFEAGLAYAAALTLDISNRTVIPVVTLTREGALSLGKDKGETIVSQMDAVGALSLNKDKALALTNFLARVGSLSLSKILVLAVNGTLITPQSLSLSRDLGISATGLADFYSAIALAKSVTFVPTHEFIGQATLPTYTGNIQLIEEAGGFVELVESAAGNIVLIETPTGILILDLTP